jgi:hypothetical protein
MQLRRGEPHRFARLVLLSPAGFVDKVPFLVAPAAWALPLLTWVARRWSRHGLCAPFLIPTSWARKLFFNLNADLARVPALGELVRCAPAFLPSFKLCCCRAKAQEVAWIDELLKIMCVPCFRLSAACHSFCPPVHRLATDEASSRSVRKRRLQRTQLGCSGSTRASFWVAVVFALLCAAYTCDR